MVLLNYLFCFVLYQRTVKKRLSAGVWLCAFQKNLKEENVMKKKFALMLAAAMLSTTVLTGCGGGGSEETKPAASED